MNLDPVSDQKQRRSVDPVVFFACILVPVQQDGDPVRIYAGDRSELDVCLLPGLFALFFQILKFQLIQD